MPGTRAHWSATGKSISDAKSVGDDLSDLLKGGTDGVANFTKVYDELSQSANGSVITQLAQQIATLTLQQMVANLRRQQANDTLVAAQARVTDYAAEVQTASNLLNQWSADQTFLSILAREGCDQHGWLTAFFDQLEDF